MPGRNKTKQLAGLFLAAVLAVTPGCSDNGSGRHVHVDTNHDGYCDEDGEPMTRRSPVRSSYYNTGLFQGGDGSSEHVNTKPTGVTSGVKGGIGSGNVGGGG